MRNTLRPWRYTTEITVNLNLKYPYLPTELDFERAPLETLISSGPVRLSTVYSDLSLSAQALLSLWPSLEQVNWSDEDPVRTQMADLFHSEVLGFSREVLSGTPQEHAGSSAPTGMKGLKALFKRKEMETIFKLIMEDLEEVDSDPDPDTGLE